MDGSSHVRETGSGWDRRLVGALAALAVTFAGIGIWSIARHTSGPVKLAVGPVKLSGNGEIVFLSINQGFINGDLYRVDPNGSGLQRLTTSRDMTVDFAFSPDGSRIVFSSTIGEDTWNVGVMNADGSGRHMLTDAGPLGSPTHAINEFPSWLPDGSAIRYYRNTADFHVPGPGQGLWIVKPDGSDARLVRPNWIPFTPSWSPDGSHIAYSHEPGIAITNPYGQGQQQLVGGAASQPDWSPDGSKIVFVDNHAIQVIGVDGSGRKTLFACDSSCLGAAFPTWSPDGRKIAFVVDTKINASKLEVMNVDGSGAHVLPVGSSLMPASLDWQPVPQG